jgi:hydroxymethylglutaryl-CoA synthase
MVLEQQDPQVFNEGMPLANTADLPRIIDRFVVLCQALTDFQGVVVCHVRGKVRGGGMAFPAAATVCYCAEDSSFGLPEVHHGLVPGVVSAVLARKIAQARLQPYLLTGEPFDATTAVSLGLCHQLLPVEKFPTVLRRLTENAPACNFMQKNFGSVDPRAMGTVMGDHFLGKAAPEPSQDQDGRVISLEWRGQVAVLTMKDEVGHNTFSQAMAMQLEGLLDELSRARCIVLHSALPSVFHVGANPAAFRKMRGEPKCLVASKMKAFYSSWLRFFKLGKPVIAVLHGKVFGGGLPIALWSDYRIAALDVDLHYGNISRGMSPAAQLSEQLQQHLSPGALMDFYLSNAHWDAARGQREGLLQHVCPSKAEALHEALELAEFVGRHPEGGVLKTLSVVRLAKNEEVVNLESWLIADSVVEGQVFTNPSGQDVSWTSSLAIAPAPTELPWRPSPPPPTADGTFGIVAMVPYVSGLALSAAEMEANGVKANRFLQKEVAVWDVNEDSLEIIPVDRSDIGRLEVGTESNVDMAKSIKSYLMQLFPDNPELEGVDNISACYGGTAALLNTIAWLRSGAAGKRYGIVVATDTAYMDSADVGWLGSGAMAMLIGPEPAIEIRSEHVSYMKNAADFFQPRHSKQLSPYMDGNGSMQCYLSALKYTTEMMKARHGVSLSSIDKVAVHGGVCKSVIVKACNEWSKWEGMSKTSLLEKYECSGRHAELLGAQYTASLYFNLHSVLEHAETLPSNMLLFSYGSGSAATLLAAKVHRLPLGFSRLAPVLAERRQLTFAEAKAILERHLEHRGRYGETHPLETIPVRAGAYYSVGLPACGAGRAYARAGKEVHDKVIHLVETCLGA